MLSRRAFLKAGVVLGCAVGIQGFMIEPKDLRVEEVKIPVKGLAAELEGFTVCQITDIHHSSIVGLEYVEKTVALANSLKPDLTVLTGDYIDEDRGYMAPVIKALTKLKARYGVLSILGNHDHFIGKDYTVDVISSSKIPLLENSNRIIEVKGKPLCVAGVKDFWEDMPDLKAALAGVDMEIPRVLLCHHPDYAEYLPEGERVDVMLSGHTHGGQVRLPFSIAPILPSNFGQKYSGGLVDLNWSTKVYVSRGIGVVMIPVRLNCPPELTLIRLVRGEVKAA